MLLIVAFFSHCGRWWQCENCSTLDNMQRQLIDITRPIHPDMAVYPGNPTVQFSQITAASPDSSAVTAITLGSHTGTHIDAPAHIAAHEPGTGQYDLTLLNGPCEVVEVLADSLITRHNLPATAAERVLLKTRNSVLASEVFDATFIALDDGAAEELVRRGVRLVGIDGPSIKKKGVKNNVHRLLLTAGIVIIEGLVLRDVLPGAYTLWCLPLAVNLDGAPVRAVLQP